MQSGNDFWERVEEFLTTIPKVVLWILLVVGFCSTGIFGGILCLVAFVLFCFNKK